MLNLYLFKDDAHLCSMRSIFCVGVEDIYEATCYVVSSLLSVFAHSFFFVCFFFFLACCSRSDYTVCPHCFIGSVCSVLLASHSLCQNEARARSLLNSNTLTKIPHRNVPSFCSQPWTYPSWMFVGLSFVFRLQGRPSVGFMFSQRGNNLLLNHWVQYHSRY